MADEVKAPEETLESLQVKVGSLETQLKDEQTAHELTKQELATAVAKNEAAHAALSEATGVIEGQAQTIKELEAKVIALQTSPEEFPTITVAKKAYLVTVKSFKYKKKDYTVQDLLADKELQKELVKLGVGYIVEKEA